MTIHRANEVLADRYKVVNKIGAGGMQEVYRVIDTIFDREVALKVPKNPAAVRRFQKSAALSARINHPNVAKTLDFFDQSSNFYLVEELVPGQDLSAAKDRLEVMDPYLVAHLLHHIAKGVAASHDAGVVHRDLKPSNIVVSPSLSFEVIKITDFGIARMTQEEMVDAIDGGNDTITNSSTVAGAIPYLSPEMVERPRTADRPTDIWAIGAIGFELLSGTKPYGKGLVAIPRIMAAEPLVIPDLAVSNSQFADTSRAVFEIINSCLQKDPADRPTAAKLVSDCERLCYPLAKRQLGCVVGNRHTSWFARVDGREVFYHPSSVYGTRPRMGQAVLLAPHPASPHPRAHPVLAVTQSASEE